MKKATSQDPIIRVRLGAQHGSWLSLAQACGKTPSGLLHDMAAERLALLNRGSPVARALAGKLDPKPKRLGTTLSISTSEEKLLKKLLESSGLSLPSLLVMLVRLYGLKKPFLSKEELDQIQRLNVALTRAGNCLNDMPKRLEKLDVTERMTVWDSEALAKQLEEKARELSEVSDEARAIVRSIRNRFSLELEGGGK